MEFSAGWQPQPLDKPQPKSLISPAQALARWLVLVWERPGGEGNDLLHTALPGCENLAVSGNWPQSADVDDVLRDLVKRKRLTQEHWCPDAAEMARYVAPGAPYDCKDSDGIGFYGAAYYYRPVFNAEYAQFVEKYRHLLLTLPRSGKIGIGDRVRFTTMFLGSTGQARTAEAKRIWTVKPCACSSCVGGRLVAVNERRDTKEQLEEYKADPEYCQYLKQHPWKHIAAFNLRKA